MPKILGNSSGKNNKSCSVFHQESNKIEFAFTKFSQTILLFKKLLFTKVPGTFCRFTTIPSVHPKHPGKNSDLAMWPIGRGGRPGRRNSGEADGLGRAGVGAGWSRGCPRPVWEVGRGGDATGDGRWRRTRAAAAVACRPARGCAGWGDGWLLELLRTLKGCPWGRSTAEEGTGMCPVAAAMGDHGGLGGARAGSVHARTGSDIYIGDSHSAFKKGEQRERPATGSGREARGQNRVRLCGRNTGRADSHGARAVCGLGAWTSGRAAASGRSTWERGPVVWRVRRGAGAPARATSRRSRFWRNCFILGHFEHVLLPIFELKCTKW
jgi:hypothetical protein